MARWASRYVKPPRTGVPTPGASLGSRASMSRLRWMPSLCWPAMASAWRITSEIPRWSISDMVKTCTAWVWSRSFSDWSMSRAPTITMFCGEILGDHSPMWVKRVSPIPADAARIMPCIFPEGVVWSILKSPCASIQTTPTFLCTLATPLTEPRDILWSPPKMRGNSPSCSDVDTIFSSSWATCTMGSRYFSLGLPRGWLSGWGTITLPISCTVYPRLRKRSFRPA